jgi:hypothetical protein
MLLGGFLSIFLLGGCGGGSTKVHLTVGAEGFEPPVATVDAGKSFDLEVENDTQAVQTVTVQDRPGLRVRPGETFSRDIDGLKAGDHKVTLADAPFEATIHAR